jgi:hypothetical protein
MMGVGIGGISCGIGALLISMSSRSRNSTRSSALSSDNMAASAEGLVVVLVISLPVAVGVDVSTARLVLAWKPVQLLVCAGMIPCRAS